MVDLESPRRRWSVRMFGVMALCVATAVAQPVAVSPRLQVKFPALNGGKPAESAAVPLEGGSLIVVVAASGANPTSPEMQWGGRAVPLEVIGHDPVSRLVFIKVPDSIPAKATEWLKEAGPQVGTGLTFMDADGPAKCRSTRWIKQVGGKILPLALLEVNFGKAVPSPGTALMDESGHVVGIVFQSAGGNTGYAIPAEAVHRVRKDICGPNRQLTRGWLGLGLRAESQVPVVSSVLPGSPAAAAGIQPNDVLTAVGARRIADYADAANAFFYLIPGQPVKVSLLRAAQPVEYSLTPVSPK
ncbi:MAG: PDZ domain-containing protein [Verrucomicrobiaceae bacterium]|nr:MAG: PDZ domain-containing protein [Verrucomicrobiaceae bacterium]